MPVRRFTTSSGDYLDLVATNAYSAAAFSFAILMRPQTVQSQMAFQWHTGIGTGSPNGGYGSEMFADGRYSVWNGSGNFSSPTGWVRASQWQIIVACKPNGTLPVRHRIFHFNTGLWQNAVTSNVPNATAVANAYLGIGHYGSSYYLNADIAAVCFWTTDLTDEQVFALATASNLEGWRNVGSPRGLWLFNQAAVTTQVRDQIAGTGEQGRLGTTVVNENPPIPYSPPPTAPVLRSVKLLGPEPEVYADAVINDSPNSWMRFNEGSGTSAVDEITGTPGTYEGEITGSPGLIASDPSNGAVLFDGATTFVSMPDSSAFDLTDAGTIEAWVRSDGAPSTNAILDKGPGSYILRGDGSGYILFRQNSVQNICTSTVQLPTGVPVHVVVTWDGDDVHIYFNGTDVSGPVTMGGPFDNTDLDLLIGVDDTFSHWDGVIDEVALYPGALSPERVRAHYDAGAGTDAGPEWQYDRELWTKTAGGWRQVTVLA